MFGPPEIHWARIHRILACPYCHASRAIPARTARTTVRCEGCHRVFLITKAGVPLATKAGVPLALDRTYEAIFRPRRRPSRLFIDRRVDEGDEVDPKARGVALMRLPCAALRGLRSTAIAALAFAAVTAAMYVFVTALFATHAVTRRALFEGSMPKVRTGVERQPPAVFSPRPF